jgi:hypothetical protein
MISNGQSSRAGFEAQMPGHEGIVVRQILACISIILRSERNIESVSFGLSPSRKKAAFAAGRHFNSNQPFILADEAA